MPWQVVDPYDVLGRLVDTLRMIPELLPFVSNDPDNIFLYDDEGDLTAAIADLKRNKLMVYWAGIDPQTFPSTVKIRFAIVFRVRQPALAYQAMLGGTSLLSGSDGLQLVYSTIHPKFHPMALPTLERSQIILSNNGGTFDFWLLTSDFVNIRA